MEQNRLTIELDDQMIELMSKFQVNPEDPHKFIRVDKDFDFYKSFLFERIRDIQRNPMNYSDEDFETIDRMVKMMTDQHNHKFFYEK